MKKEKIIKQWEYKKLKTDEVFEIAFKIEKDGNIYDRLFITCQELGKEGWELCGIFDNPDPFLYEFYFKRELNQNNRE